MRKRQKKHDFFMRLDLQDERDAAEVDAACKEVRAHEDTELEGVEAADDRRALRLRVAAADEGGGEAGLDESVREGGGARVVVAKDERLEGLWRWAESVRGAV